MVELVDPVVKHLHLAGAVDDRASLGVEEEPLDVATPEAALQHDVGEARILIGAALDVGSVDVDQSETGEAGLDCRFADLVAHLHATRATALVPHEPAGGHLAGLEDLQGCVVGDRTLAEALVGAGDTRDTVVGSRIGSRRRGARARGLGRGGTCRL